MQKRRRPQVTGFFRRLRELTRRSEKRERSLLLRLRNRLVVGLLVAFPLVVTVFLARIVFRVLDRWFQPISEHFFQIRIHGAGMLLAVLGLVLLGTLATNVLGSRILDAFERFVARLPLFSPIYQGARQITEAVQIRGSRDFQKVVLVAFPHPGIRSIGFVTRELNRPTAFGEEPTFMVFIPTTPNPTSGFLVAVPQSQCTVLEIDVEEGIKLVISGGLLTPPVLMAPGYLTNLASHDREEDQDEARNEDHAGPVKPTAPLQR